MSETATGQDTASAGPFMAEPVVRAGAWYEDQWITPYVRADFHLPSAPAKLVFQAYVPASAEYAPTIAVRQGLDLLCVVNELVVDGVTPVTIDLPPHTETSPVPISLRVSKAFSSQGDERDLGVVLTEWHVLIGT